MKGGIVWVMVLFGSKIPVTEPFVQVISDHEQ